MSRESRCSPLRVLIFILLKCGTTRPMLASDESSFPRLVVAASHTALSGDLGVLIIELPAAAPYPTAGPEQQQQQQQPQAPSAAEAQDDEDYSIENAQIPLQEPLVLRVLWLHEFRSELVGEVPVEVPNVAGLNVSLKVPCGLFSRGGTYSLQLQPKSAPVPDRLTGLRSTHAAATVDVRWPVASLAVEPQHLDTYPSQPVLATLDYPGVTCAPAAPRLAPDFVLELLYCGGSVASCDPRNQSGAQRLYQEPVHGFPQQLLLTLRCELFGLAGHYALRLRPRAGSGGAPTSSAYLKVEWSDLFVFNVHARSVYPCEAGGVAVLFEYPACRLPGDRVRLYGRLRADVASLAPPSTLHYVAELKAPPGKHALTFDCDLFTERYVEYCFAYISQAYNGAMSEVRVDCIPTFPLQEGDAGGWGDWSQWSPCSSSCVGGTRTRHRFCDRPPPRYGAKFCQGGALEWEACGGSARLDLRGEPGQGDWECRHGPGLAADRPEVQAALGPGCRCGCTLDLGPGKPRALLAASSRTCRGRSLWLLRGPPRLRLLLGLDQARFPAAACPQQRLLVRDGDSLGSPLLLLLAAGEPGLVGQPAQARSSGPRMLVEFEAGPADGGATEEEEVVEDGCLAGFLAHVEATEEGLEEEGAAPGPATPPRVTAAAGRWALWLTPAHLVAASLLGLSFLLSALLALQYAFKYRKYRVAEDLDSLTDASACSGSAQGLARRARVLSSATLLSEVVSLVRLPRRGGGSPRHARLEETAEAAQEEAQEEGYESTGTQPESASEAGEEQSQRTIQATPSGSSSTLNAQGQAGQAEVKYARPVKLRTFGPVSPVSEEAASTSEDGRRFSATSASTSLNNVRVVPHPKPTSNLLQIKGFSPASSSSNSTLRRYSGKEKKDRRNRERLLQGPGSEFSLANQELDLELDYYDYNVVNAGAAPGSYLGMDPAFLVWIPPFSEDETEAAAQEPREEPHYEEIPDRGVQLSTEGAALTPEQYRKVREAGGGTTSCQPEDSSENDSEEMIRPRRLDPGECRLHDEIIMEYKARLGEGLLPIHRLLEESRVRVSEESLSNASDVIPNRLPSRTKAPSRRLPKRTRKSSRLKVPGREASSLSSESSSHSLDAQETVNDLDTPRTRRRFNAAGQNAPAEYCEVNISAEQRTPDLPRRHRDLADLNAAGGAGRGGSDGAVNIPLAEFSRNRQESPVKVHSSGWIGGRSKVTLQSPDYGVDVVDGSKDRSFYDLIGEGEDGIKFADDDDEYIDNKVVA